MTPENLGKKVEKEEKMLNWIEFHLDEKNHLEFDSEVKSNSVAASSANKQLLHHRRSFDLTVLCIFSLPKATNIHHLDSRSELIIDS